MRELTLEGEVRTAVGKRSRALRRSGTIPGVFYLHGESNVPVAIPEKSLKPLIYTAETHIINLRLSDGSARSCILRDIQFDPVTDRPIHVDFQGVREDEEISIEVPVTLTGGTPVGVRDGGIVQQVIHRLKISCLPKFIPEHVEVNIAELKMNHFVHVRDLKLANITILESENSSIVGVVPPTIEKEPVAAGTPVEEAVEPEVIAKGKKPEEGAEGAPATGEKKAEAPAAAGKKGEAAAAAPAKGAAPKEEKK